MEHNPFLCRKPLSKILTFGIWFIVLINVSKAFTGLPNESKELNKILKETAIITKAENISVYSALTEIFIPINKDRFIHDLAQIQGVANRIHTDIVLSVANITAQFKMDDETKAKIKSYQLQYRKVSESVNSTRTDYLAFFEWLSILAATHQPPKFYNSHDENLILKPCTKILDGEVPKLNLLTKLGEAAKKIESIGLNNVLKSLQQYNDHAITDKGVRTRIYDLFQQAFANIADECLAYGINVDRTKMFILIDEKSYPVSSVCLSQALNFTTDQYGFGGFDGCVGKIADNLAELDNKLSKQVPQTRKKRGFFADLFGFSSKEEVLANLEKIYTIRTGEVQLEDRINHVLKEEQDTVLAIEQVSARISQIERVTTGELEEIKDLEVQAVTTANRLSIEGMFSHYERALIKLELETTRIKSDIEIIKSDILRILNNQIPFLSALRSGKNLPIGLSLLDTNDKVLLTIIYGDKTSPATKYHLSTIPFLYRDKILSWDLPEEVIILKDQDYYFEPSSQCTENSCPIPSIKKRYITSCLATLQNDNIGCTPNIYISNVGLKQQALVTEGNIKLFSPVEDSAELKCVAFKHTVVVKRGHNHVVFPDQCTLVTRDLNINHPIVQTNQMRRMFNFEQTHIEFTSEIAELSHNVDQHIQLITNSTLHNNITKLYKDIMAYSPSPLDFSSWTDSVTPTYFYQLSMTVIGMSMIGIIVCTCIFRKKILSTIWKSFSKCCSKERIGKIYGRTRARACHENELNVRRPLPSCPDRVMYRNSQIVIDGIEDQQ